MPKRPPSADSLFVRSLHSVFRWFGRRVAQRPLLWLSISFVFTVFASSRIPFTPLTNDVSDFTPASARARPELQTYKDFFSNDGDPVTVYVFVTAKNEGNMLGIRELEETVRLLNHISLQMPLLDPLTQRNRTFSQFCLNFCSLNEPVRHFYNGLLVEKSFGNSSEHIDLGYPITTVLGRQIHMDPNFFGVKISARIGNESRIVSVNDFRIQIRNNLKEIKLIGLQFRAELSASHREAIRKWETEVIDFVEKEFKAETVEAMAFSEKFLTEEVVRSGLSLIPFLGIGFGIMCIFSVITMGASALYMGDLGFHTVVLAIMACVCPFMACGTALGLMFWCGMRFGSILCVTPFLVLAIGVDDAYLMVNSWQQIRKREKRIGDRKGLSRSERLESLLVEVMVDTGPSITITTLTNFLAFAIGILTPTPEIQLFSIGNALAIVIDYIYQWTIYGSVMVLAGDWELRSTELKVTDSETPKTKPKRKSKRFSAFKKGCNRFLEIYCSLLTNWIVASAIVALLAGYMYISIYGVLEMRAELRPEQLFLQDSPVVKVLDLRNRYIIPYYAVCVVFVNNPGNISDPQNVQRLSQLVADFESLPSALGRFSTKFFLRDYLEFVRSGEDSSQPLLDELAELGAEEHLNEEKNGNELRQFLEWPEFQFWKGFVRVDPKIETQLTRFFFTTASHGAELRDWSRRAQLLTEWRRVADAYPDLKVTVYEEDAKFLDLIPTMIPQTLQSSLCTLICMFIVCLLFIRQPTAVIIANFSILSTCTGVFGILSMWGVELDPIVMSAAIMSIGFSVDIPAHISYHFYKTGGGDMATVEERLRHCLRSIGFPVLEAGISTIICVMSLTFVELHMARVFAKTMVLVVGIGLIHGLVVIPVMLFLVSLIPERRTEVDSPTPMEVRSL